MNEIFNPEKNIIVLKPKTLPKTVFNYKGIGSLKDLIQFTGSEPKVKINDKGEIEMSYRKKVLKDNSLVFCDAFGNVSEIMTYAEAAEIYEITAQKDTEAKEEKKSKK